MNSDFTDVGSTDLAPQLQKVITPTDAQINTSPREFIKDKIQIAIEQTLATKETNYLIKPTQEELQHASVMFKDKGWNNISTITYSSVNNIARKEFSDLNEKLKTFTSKMSLVKTPGLFTLIDILSKEVNDADLDNIWMRTVNAKPSLMARIRSWFNPSAIGENLQGQYENVYKILTERSKGLEVKLGNIERNLLQQKHEQENNIAILNGSFEMYYISFQEIRKQFVFVMYLEEFYKQELENYRAANVDKMQDLNVIKKLSEYESTYNDIVNKRLVLHGALIKFPITVKQNENLIGVCKNILKEIDNTLLSNFVSIRTNLSGLAVALNAQQAMLGNNSARLLDEQSSKLAMKINKDLTVKAETLASESRLRDAHNIKGLIQELVGLTEEVQRAKETNRENIEKATQLLNESTAELNQLLGNNNGSRY